MCGNFAGSLASLGRWSPPEDWVRLETIDAHTEGEPLRIVTGGYPGLPGGTMLARRGYARENLDHLRKILMWEPRGHADMYGCLITPPVSTGADFGVLFLHTEGYSSMCGHGVIAVATVAVEAGMVQAEAPETRLGIDTPAGLVTAYAQVEDGIVQSVRVHNVASFVEALDKTVTVPALGEVRYDLAFGGAYYAFVDAGPLGLELTGSNASRLVEHGMAIKKAVMASHEIQHPFEQDLSFLYGTIFMGPPADPAHHSRHVCVFANGQIDRSPTGTGVSARAAILHARGELSVGDSIVVESIIGSRFRVGVVETTPFGRYPAVIPEVEGRAFMTGRHSFAVDPRDLFKEGFLVR